MTCEDLGGSPRPGCPVCICLCSRWEFLIFLPSRRHGVIKIQKQWSNSAPPLLSVFKVLPKTTRGVNKEMCEGEEGRWHVCVCCRIQESERQHGLLSEPIQTDCEFLSLIVEKPRTEAPGGQVETEGNPPHGLSQILGKDRNVFNRD